MQTEPIPISSPRTRRPRSAYSHQQHALVSLSGKDISTFNNKTVLEKTTPLSTPLTPQHYSFALLLDGSLLCCGGQISGGTAKNTYIISADETVSVQRDMIHARESHGILAFGRKVFAFGGTEGFVNMVLKNEMFEEGSWSLLPELRDPRFEFVPCIYQCRIYLPGGTSVEVFDPEAMSMSVLDGVTISGPYSSVATIHENCLIVLKDSKVFRWNFKTKSMKTKNTPSSWILHATRTVQKKNLLYAMRGFGLGCSVIELKTGKLLSLT